MRLLTNVTMPALWYDLIKDAENACSVSLEQDLEAYLISLLIRYTNQPNLSKQVLAIAFLNALALREHERKVSLQTVGDHCLLFAGLFPLLARKKRVKISYFVGLGQSAYASASKNTNDLFGSLSTQFVSLMDILQSIRADKQLEPLEAYELWDEVGSKRALCILQSYYMQNKKR